jgi:hypothetical protein
LRLSQRNATESPADRRREAGGERKVSGSARELVARLRELVERKPIEIGGFAHVSDLD